MIYQKNIVDLTQLKHKTKLKKKKPVQNAKYFGCILTAKFYLVHIQTKFPDFIASKFFENHPLTNK